MKKLIVIISTAGYCECITSRFVLNVLAICHTARYVVFSVINSWKKNINLIDNIVNFDYVKTGLNFIGCHCYSVVVIFGYEYRH